ncbi:deoxyribonuclease-2-alpha-like [Leguminivora glycinivorella]|uniref:deoxyribonuclease-2-alpha-like n=1 Tax=Leguminivora glycinivorella TaxID=1035111 RepID=UPI00200CC903|nr:deoxyribonuclease-2-alpha-like [Leguminivora glycinivorella]
MDFILIFLIGSLLECYEGYVIKKGDFGQHCSDGDNPVPWWYIYKPPAGVVHPSGLNFSFLTPDTEGRWIQSLYDITEADMLSKTLMPEYKKRSSHKDRGSRAMIIFQARHGAPGSSARGVIIADEKGGFLITHTVPGFPQRFSSVPLFPYHEAESGHLISCVSLDLDALNKVARGIKEIAPNITYSYTPEALTHLLPEWDFTRPLQTLSSFRLRPSIYSLIRVNRTRTGEIPRLRNTSFYYSSSGPVEAVLVARPSGVKSCIYSSFAARQLVMLNVYGRSRSTFLTTTCSKSFGVRNIDLISFKYEGTEGPIYYVPTSSADSTWFAVSTAAHWQQRGEGPRQFWVCTSLLDKEDITGAGALLLCLQNYNLWVAFDNLKVSEPSCD